MTSCPIWEPWMTLFVISHSHEPPSLRVSGCLAVSYCDLLSPMSRLTPLFSPPWNPHAMPQYGTAWHVICPYTSCCHGQQVLITKDVTHCGLWYHTKIMNVKAPCELTWWQKKSSGYPASLPLRILAKLIIIKRRSVFFSGVCSSLHPVYLKYLLSFV